ncbi:hypothetical protein [Mesorhizobium carmichaelinearum]|uniref:hypothetical protein n=1 Tax=Mesorhizobium carmichaelinearum TaxID=1208188 RepID=UPI0011803F43|nr:hypothetical protein [Mesorhizobium carmichaelinearum]
MDMDASLSINDLFGRDGRERRAGGDIARIALSEHRTASWPCSRIRSTNLLFPVTDEPHLTQFLVWIHMNFRGNGYPGEGKIQRRYRRTKARTLSSSFLCCRLHHR